MKSLQISSNIHDYQVLFSENLNFLNSLMANPHCVFVIDRKVYDLFPDTFKKIHHDDLMLFSALESIKTMESVFSIYRFLARRESKKNIHLVSIGGGILQDISGYAASTLYRGIHWTFIPTTLLAQADSCVGSKTSLNFEEYKNIIGSFYPPHQVLICSQFLNSLSEDEINSGIGEIIKFMLLDDRNEVSISNIGEVIYEANSSGDFSKAIYTSLGVKQHYIKQDEFDRGKRNLFNYGHCFGHALEYSSEYRIPHGIAVIYGMILANFVALERGYISSEFNELLFEKLFRKFLSVSLRTSDLDDHTIISALKKDKKRTGKDLTLILPSSNNIEAIKVSDLKEDEVKTVLNHCKRYLGIK